MPSAVDGGWAAHRERFADRVEARIEGLAPGFRKRVLARAITTPDDLAAMNENLAGGDITGGSARIQNQLVFRPVPAMRGRAATGVPGLFLGSASAHPGGGVHGAAGANAARAALWHHRLRALPRRRTTLGGGTR